jgi:predicted kinase
LRVAFAGDFAVDAEVKKSGDVPVVVALIGLPGSGKSIAARALQDQMGLRRVCRDTIRQAMFPRCSYSFAEKRAAFRSLLLAVEVNCMLGESSVIDGVTFSRHSDLQRVDAAIRRYGCLPIPIYLDCPPDIARARIADDIANNRHLARDRTPEIVADVMIRFDPPPANAIVINSDIDASDLCRMVIQAVNQVRVAAPR